ncbi:hypothetical protein PFISCL1PPCAC_29173 [Pristionchus fissidentatus]|uniref:IBB domain-containing protein n=1 Tax=Pristionchus fissidentatus TaxID=1538716 RepID=A0AAV5WZJ1_9BILA|nr:hypothetical protein PFISCL1PPCAC_11769 [Pristionchus fissidentatus]GMT37876.1 hypothetical protein PFISCL1PPCAC_29173 [Pristionchus fissidentatus]
MPGIFRMAKSKDGKKNKSAKEKERAKAYYHEELERRQNRARKKRNVLIDRLIDPGQTTVMAGVTEYQSNTAMNERQDTEFSDIIVEELKKRQKYEDSLRVIVEKKKKTSSLPSEWIRRICIFGERLAVRQPLMQNLDGTEHVPHNLPQLSLQCFPLSRDLPSDQAIAAFTAGN